MKYRSDASHEQVDSLYDLLEELRDRVGGYRDLGDCDGRSGWPERGVYFFFEGGEKRRDGKSLRVVRVGTHALKAGSRTTLWKRLSQHKGRTGGAFPGGGNHRGSIFRWHVGTALLTSHHYPTAIESTWRVRKGASAKGRAAEYPLEREVSAFIRELPFLWVAVDDPAGPDSDRGVIERNSIALLSNGRSPVDPSSPTWLGLHADASAIPASGLWNVNHVDDGCDPSFLEVLARHVTQM